MTASPGKLHRLPIFVCLCVELRGPGGGKDFRQSSIMSEAKSRYNRLSISFFPWRNKVKSSSRPKLASVDLGGMWIPVLVFLPSSFFFCEGTSSLPFVGLLACMQAGIVLTGLDWTGIHLSPFALYLYNYSTYLH